MRYSIAFNSDSSVWRAGGNRYRARQVAYSGEQFCVRHRRQLIHPWHMGARNEHYMTRGDWMIVEERDVFVVAPHDFSRYLPCHDATEDAAWLDHEIQTVSA